MRPPPQRSILSQYLDLWVVGDQLLKGAALNAIQIAELILKRIMVLICYILIILFYFPFFAPRKQRLQIIFRKRQSSALRKDRSMLRDAAQPCEHLSFQ